LNGPAGAGIYLGTGSGGWAWAGPERSALVLGPSRSGKTSSLVVPNVLAAPGAVVSTSTKADVLDATAASRSGRGWTFLYDPSGTVDVPRGVQRIGWSPLGTAVTWDGALSVADGMVRAAHGLRSATPFHGDHWSERATALLAPLLHAAACSTQPMATVLRWVDRHQGETALSVLGAGGPTSERAADLLAGILTTDEREQSGIWSTASGTLGAYRSAAALASTEPPFLDPDAFCDAANTLFVCAPGRYQQLLAPLVVGVLTDVRDATYRRAAGGHRTPPVLLALDEAANIAPLPDLPQIVSEGTGQGLLPLVCLQDLSQARARWGQQGEAFVSLFGTTVVLRGIADLPTLDALSALGGEIEITTRTVGTAQGGDGRLLPSTSLSTIWRRRLPVDAIARGAPGAALAVDSTNRIGWVGLTPAHTTAPWCHLLGRERPVRPRDTRDDRPAPVLDGRER